MSERNLKSYLVKKLREINENRRQGIYEVIGNIVRDLKKYGLLEEIDQIYLRHHNLIFEDMMKKTYKNKILKKTVLKSSSDANKILFNFQEKLKEPYQNEIGIKNLHKEFESLFINGKSLMKFLVRNATLFLGWITPFLI